MQLSIPESSTEGMSTSHILFGFVLSQRVDQKVDEDKANGYIMTK